MNINNQTEYKKPFGSRFFILLTVCMIVVAMAGSAFAFSIPDTLPVNLPYPSDFISITSEMPDIPEAYEDSLFVIFDGEISGTRMRYVFAVTEETSFSMTPDFYPSISNTLHYWDGRIVSDGSIVWRSYSATSFISGNCTILGIERSDIPIYLTDGTLFYEGPKDFSKEVTGVLPTVLSWIQQTLNALFVEGGALQGLLLLVAVPVAITLLLLGARFIRSVIWGA